MPQTDLNSILAVLQNQLASDQLTDGNLKESLPELVEALSRQDPSSIRNQRLTIDQSDIFFRKKMTVKESDEIRKIVGLRQAATDKEQVKIFIRELPVRTTQVAGSVPNWGTGAKVIKTIGPIRRIDGRRVVIDVFRVVQLVKIFQQNQANPMILFSSSFIKPKLIIGQQTVPAQANYDVAAGTVWVRADLLANGAPTDRYCGLAVKNGKVELTAAPVLQNNNLVLGMQTGVTVTLQLNNQAPAKTKPQADYGIDAFETALDLPATFKFRFSPQGQKQILEVGPAQIKVYSQVASFGWQANLGAPIYNPVLSRVGIPIKCSEAEMAPQKVGSPLLQLSGKAAISKSWWAIPAAILDTNQPLEAAGAGAIAIETKEGIRVKWRGQQGSSGLLMKPLFLIDHDRIGITDLAAMLLGSRHELIHWKDEMNVRTQNAAEELGNPIKSIHPCKVELLFQAGKPFIYNTMANGSEILMTLANARIDADRPVKVDGLPFKVNTKDSLVLIGADHDSFLVYLIDDNILWDNKLPFDKVPAFVPSAIALENALLTVSPVNSCIIFAECTPDFSVMVNSQTFFTLGLMGYVPTLPDPYLAKFGWLRQFNDDKRKGSLQAIRSWLVCRVVQQDIPGELDEVKVDFFFAPAANSNPQPGAGQPESFGSAEAGDETSTPEALFAQQSSDVSPDAFASTGKGKVEPLPPYEDQYDEKMRAIETDLLALLDVSSNANQLGISFGMSAGVTKTDNKRVVTGVAVETGENNAAIQINSQAGALVIEGLYAKMPGSQVRLFMMPQIAWEPVVNLSYFTNDPKPNFPFELAPIPGDRLPGDPEVGFNYYPNDGGPSRIYNTSAKPAALAPIPLTKFLLENYKNKSANLYLQFTLGFGMKAVATLTHNSATETIKPTVDNLRPNFEQDLRGGIQIRSIAGNHGKKFDPETSKNDSRMFGGFTVQLNNINNSAGAATGWSTLGHSVTQIFNGEFFVAMGDQTNTLLQRGVPVERVDFTGYGSSLFSNWLSPSAAIAQTSQARFDVMLGRTAHEVIQVKSIVYPWGIRVVRTITIFRTASGYVFRVDSGWQPESDGLFDFRYTYILEQTQGFQPPQPKPNQEIKKLDPIGGKDRYAITEIPYSIHPGTVHGLFNITNIREDASIAPFNEPNNVGIDEMYIDETGILVKNESGSVKERDVVCNPVWFDANIKIENPVQGHTNGMVACKKILGYVQIAPPGVPLTPLQFKNLLNLQGGSIGGDVDCVIDINKSGQQMRISRFDISHSVKETNDNNDPIFVVASRGSVLLPKDGSWSMVQHNVSTGDVVPLPTSIPVPLIRVGEWVKENVVNQADVTGKLLRIADPADLLRAPQATTQHFGFLQATATQKALFLTPSFRINTTKLLSKTPPLFADAYRLMTGSGIFPNIGNAVDNFGKAMAMLDGVDDNGNKIVAFVTNSMQDGGKDVLELMDVLAQKAGDAVVDQGYKLLKGVAGQGNNLLNKAIAFDVPAFEVPLVEMDGLRIYIEYKTGKKNENANQYIDSKLNFDVDSFASDLGNTWKSRMNNVAMVVDLGSMQRLMTIKGNFDAQKGKESGYEGGNGGPFDGIPLPEIEFSDALEPVIELLQMLAALSTGDYGEVMRRGLKIAMSNAGEIWEYKFEAGKEIPLIRFPPTDAAYNSAQTPLKLEASLALGVSFNAALKITNDPKQLLPSAGAFIQFKGGLEVMCCSVGVGTIFAVGAVELKVACDTAKGPSLFMKFGFGATLAVSLPVIATVSVTFIVGCEIEADTQSITITAFMLFKGHASILGGIVSVTIYIEASGSVRRIGNQTDCKAQVTFGLDISIFLIINISFEETWEESRQIA